MRIFKLSPQQFFSIFALIFGIYQSLITPMGFPVAADEVHHYLRVIQLSQGHIIGSKYNGKSGGYIWEHNKEIFKSFPNTVLYSPVPYIPSVIAYKLLNYLNINTRSIQIRLIRIFPLCFSILLIYYAIKLIPFSKYSLTFFALSPLIIHQLSYITADSLTIAFCILFISKILQLTYDQYKLKKIEFFLLLILYACICLCKQAYFPLGLLLITLPNNLFISKKQKALSIIIILVVGLSLMSLWYFAVKPIYTPYLSTSHPHNATKQIAFIISHPFYFISIVLKSTFSFHDNNKHFIPMRHSIFIAYILSLLAVVIDKKTANFQPIRKQYRITYLMAFLFCHYTIISMLYISWSKIGGNITQGLHYRYILPYLFLLNIALNFSLPFNEKVARYSLYFLSVFILILNMVFIGYIHHELVSQAVS